VAAALIALAVPNAASAQIPGFLNVNTTRDDNDGECTRDCTLREAVSLSSDSSPVLLQPGVYRLTRGPLVISKNTTIYGAGFGSQQSAGARTTVIDGNNAGRALQIAAGNVSIAGVTLAGGRAATGAGAFVANGATLFLYNSIVRDNVATSRGGGLQAAGLLELFGTTVSDNRAGVGGGIAVESTGTLFVVQSTISDNTATGGGGAVATSGPYQFHNATLSGGVLGEPGSSSSAFVTNTIFAGPGAACSGNVAATPHTSWTGNLATDTTCGLAPAEGTQGQDPRLGTLRNNRGATDTRALQAGSPAIDSGDTNFCTGSDQRGASPVNTCDKGAFEFGGQVPEIQLPPPTPGETVNASRSRGTVKVKLPGSDEFFVLQDGQQLPMGTTFDTTKGRVNLVTAASNVQGPTQKAWFYKGVFKVRQSKGRKPLTTVSMTGKLQCGSASQANSAAAKKKKRRLWGNGKGRFRTKGRHSAATVVGTIWFVEDRCNGTLTRVKRGTVRVQQFKPRKTVVIKGPRGRYFAKR
jgi:CSLREA domain-containing protein